MKTHLHRRDFVKAMAATVGVGFFDVFLRADKPIAAKKFARVLTLLEEAIKAGTVPGAGIIVSQHGETIWKHSLGTYCSRDKRDNPLDESTLHILFSTSKLVASTVAVMVQQEGLFEWDAPVSTYIPEFISGGKEKITVRHMLTHSAGIPTVPLQSVETAEKWHKAVKAVCAAKVDWEPGSRSLYHGLTSSFVAAEVACRVTKKPWNTLCKEKLFGPIGAESMSYAAPPSGTRLALCPQPKDLPAPYEFLQDWLAGHPAGCCIGTLADTLKVVQLHLNKGVWKGKTLIKPDALKEMHRVQYADQIAKAHKESKVAAFQSWGLGPLIRGDAPFGAEHGWFGFGKQKSPAMFGHVGISTFMAVGDPARNLGIVFAVTNAPTPESKATYLRCEVTDRVCEAIG